MAPLLAADLVDFLKAIVPIVILIIWVLSQVFAAQGKQAPPARPRRLGPPGKGPQPASDGVAAEIEAFLRRVSQQRGEQQPADVEVLQPAPPRAQRAAPAVPRQAAVEAVDQVMEVEQAHDEVADSVARHLGKRRLAARAERLGSAVRMADQQAERRLHATFDHQVGQLEQTASAAPTDRAAQQAAGAVPTTTSPTSLAGLLQSRAGIRQAIILNEILRRPEQRW